MSIDGLDTNGGASGLVARAAAADARGDARLRAAVEDFFLSDDARLDDRLRAAIAGILRMMVATVEGALRQHAARALTVRDAPDLAARLSNEAAPILDRLIAAGIVRDADLMRELIGRVRQDIVADALPAAEASGTERPSLLARLAQHDDTVVAARAATLLAAESRRRSGEGGAKGTELPAELHHRLVWWVAAALRERFADAANAPGTAALDRALADAALRALAAHDESDRVEVAALRLAAAVDPRADELPRLLAEALSDRRLTTFVAFLAHAIGIDFAEAREVVLDPAADRLWLVLRALELSRETIARIGLALCDADPRRDLEAFVDKLDAIAALPPEAARDALAPLALHPDYRAAMLALSRGRR